MALYDRPFMLANVVNFVGLSANNFFVLLPLYLTERQVEPWAVGLMMGGYSVGAVLTRPTLGHQMDLRGRRPFILGGLLGMSVFSLMYLLAGESLPLLAVTRFLQGVAFAVFFTSLFTWVADHAPPGRMAEALGMYGMSGLLTMAVGPGLSELIVLRWGFNGMFLFAALGTAVAGGLALALPELRAGHEGDEPPGTFLQLALRPALWAVNVTVFLFGAAGQAVSAFLAPYLEVLERGSGMDVPEVSGFFTAYVAAAMVVRLVAGLAADRLGRVAVVVPAIALVAGGLWVLGRVAELPGGLQSNLLAAGMLIGLGHGTLYPTLNAMLMDRASSRDRGKAMALYTASIDLGGFVGASSYGAVATALGYARMYEVAATVMLLAVLLFLALEKGWGAQRGNSRVA